MNAKCSVHAIQMLIVIIPWEITHVIAKRVSKVMVKLVAQVKKANCYLSRVFVVINECQRRWRFKL